MVNKMYLSKSYLNMSMGLGISKLALPTVLVLFLNFDLNLNEYVIFMLLFRSFLQYWLKLSDIFE